MSKIVIGIDQSYTRTGITILKDKQILKMKSINFKECKSNTNKRKVIKSTLESIIDGILVDYKPRDIKCIVERIRTFSGGHMSTQYLISTGALIATIVDTLSEYEIPVYSVETRSWKVQIVGDTKPMKNQYGINPNKYKTILYLRSKGLLKYIAEPYNGRGKQGVINIKIDGKKTPCKINDDLADSYCIAMYGFLPEHKQKLKEEKL